MKTPKPTLEDIAAELGLSVSAVSRALRHPGRMGAQTEERIRATAERLGYTKHTFKNTASSNLIAIVVPDLNDPDTTAFVSSAQHRLASRGYRTLVSEQFNALTQDGLVHGFERMPIAGMLLDCPALRDDELRHIASQTPVVAINRSIERLRCVSVDTAIASTKLIEQLKHSGATDIALLVSPKQGWSTLNLSQHLAAAARRQGIRLRLIPDCLPTAAAGEDTLLRLLAKRPDAAIATCAPIALGVLTAANKRHINIPADLSLIATEGDSHQASDWGMAAISLPFGQLGISAAESLLAALRASTGKGVAQTGTTLLSARFTAGQTLGKTFRHTAGDSPRNHASRCASPSASASASISKLLDASERTQPVTLTVLASWLGDWDARIDAYEQLNPQVTIRRHHGYSQEGVVAEYFRRLRTGDDVPDLLLVEYRNLPQLADEGALLDLTDSGLADALRPRVLPQGWDNVHHRGRLYGVPADYDTSVMFCNDELLGRHGIEQPRTWEELRVAGIRLRAADHTAYMTLLNTVNLMHYRSLFAMAGTPWWQLRDDGETIAFLMNTEEVQTTAAFIQSCLDEHVILSGDIGDRSVRAQIRQGRIATIVYSNWFAENMSHICEGTNADGHWRVTMPPAFGDPSTLRTAHYGGTAMTLSSRIPDDKREAAIRCALWLQTNPQATALQPKRVMSVATHLHRDPGLLRETDPFFHQQLYPIFFESAERSNQGFPFLPIMAQAQASFDELVLPELRAGGESPARLLDWQHQLAALIRAKGYRVEMG